MRFVIFVYVYIQVQTYIVDESTKRTTMQQSIRDVRDVRKGVMKLNEKTSGLVYVIIEVYFIHFEGDLNGHRNTFGVHVCVKEGI